MRQTTSTEDLFSVEDPFSFDGNSDNIYSFSAHRAVSGNKNFKSLAERLSCDGPFLPPGASLARENPTLHHSNCDRRDGTQCPRDNNGVQNRGGAHAVIRDTADWPGGGGGFSRHQKASMW